MIIIIIIYIYIYILVYTPSVRSKVYLRHLRLRGPNCGNHHGTWRDECKPIEPSKMNIMFIFYIIYMYGL